MTIQFIQENIIRWVSTCKTWEHFDAIKMAVDNCLMIHKAEFGSQAIEDAEHAIGSAIVARMKELDLEPISEILTEIGEENSPARFTDSINFQIANA